jgi:CRISPR-associated protein Cas1
LLVFLFCAFCAFLRLSTMHALAITEQGTTVHVEGETLLLSVADRVARRVRLAELNQLLLFGRIELTSGAVAALARRGIDVVFLTAQGNYRARLVGRGSGQAALRLAQLRRALEPEFALRFCRALVAGKITHQRQVLLRAQRRLHDEDLADVLGRLRLLVGQAARTDDVDSLRGLEGRAAALYFSQFGKLLRAPELVFTHRTRRPPRDPVNACLSFGYALLGTAVETEVLRCGLEPLLGFFHQPHHGRPSLMLDLLEEFRPLVDTLVLRLVNRRQLGPLDFERRAGASLAEVLAESPPPTVEAPSEGAAAGDAASPAEGTGGEGVYLADTGRRIYLMEFFRRLRERLYYPPRQGTFELREVIRQQVYHLARVIEGEDADYVPFIPG